MHRDNRLKFSHTGVTTIWELMPPDAAGPILGIRRREETIRVPTQEIERQEGGALLPGGDNLDVYDRALMR